MAADSPELPASATRRRVTIEKRLDTMLVAISSAFDAFYATLTDEQKGRINSGGSCRWGWHSWCGN